MGKDQELLEAARNGNLPIVEKILGQRAKRSGPLASLRRGPGANVQDTSGYSALHHAALNGHQEIVEMLLSHEASPNIVDDKGCSPLHLAAWTGNVNIVRLLLCHGPSVTNVNLTNKDKETALHCSAQYGHTGVVSLLLEHGCDPTIRNTRMESPLDLAAQYGRLETVETLVRTHPELVASYNNRSHLSLPHTPLHLASRNGHKGVVEVLLSSGLEVNVRTSGGTALHEAALCGKVEVVRTLLDHGADLSLRDSHNNTVYELLQQFPPHVVHDITTLIKRHRGEIEEGEASLPPIPVPSLGSPYENVRLPVRQGQNSPNSSSPTHWHHDMRRVSQVSNLSQESEGPCRTVDRVHGWVSSCGLSKSMMEGSFMSEECWCEGEPDQISISSASSVGGQVAREKRGTNTEIYLPMTPSPGSNNKVSQPTPPKKPPRRNLSVSPTHLTPSSMGAYEYLFLARSGVRSQGDLDDLAVTARPHREMLRRGKSADQYVDMNLRYCIMGEEFSTEDDPKYEPIALTSVYENVPFRRTNPKRKLRRLQTERGHDGLVDPSIILSRGHLPFKRVETELLQPKDLERRVNGERESRQCPLSPTNYQQPPTPDHPPPSASQAEMSIHERIRPLSQQKKMEGCGEMVQKLVCLGSDRADSPQPWLKIEAPWQQALAHLATPSIDSDEYCNLMKRRSRDMETETEEELLLLVYPYPGGGVPQPSLVNATSSSPADHAVEEYVSDVPFAGLLKGSTRSETRLERPKTLRKLKNVYLESGNTTSGPPGSSNTEMGTTSETTTEEKANLLSPLDEQEEWAKISEIMASFGSGLVRESVFVSELEKEFQARLGLNLNNISSSDAIATPIGNWLASIDLPQYESTFINFGYDNLDFLNGVLDEGDLKEMGITGNDSRQILEAVKSLTNKVRSAFIQIAPGNESSAEEQTDTTGNQSASSSNNESSSVDEWLERLDLGQYRETFRKHLYTDMERVHNVWEVELTAVLEITKPGHRHRIIASLPTPMNQPTIQDINAELSHLKSSIQELEGKCPAGNMTGSGANGNTSNTSTGNPTTSTVGVPTSTNTTPATTTGTLRHSHKKSRPAPQPPGKQPELQIRDPSQLLVGVPSTLTAQWRHMPHALLSGHLTYHARYLGSTVVKELRGTESTKKSIQKLKKPQSEQNSSPDIYLAISYRGVKFLSGETQELVCEHEIRNIHCACQDAEDLTHFAYITKDHTSKSHYCHVFCVQTMDQATEIILTLGQAFEVAYQMALRESQTNRANNGHTRSHSANLGALPITTQPNHSRSLSVNEIKVAQVNGSTEREGISNGHPPSPAAQAAVTEQL